MSSHFDACASMIRFIIDSTVSVEDANPDFAFQVFNDTMNVFYENCDLSQSEIERLAVCYERAFEYHFGYEIYVEYFGWDVRENNESESSDSREIIKTEFGYQFI